VSTLTPAPIERPLRRDAAHNRELILDAAASVFADRGLDAGVEEIARVAGVGMGTLYRRFPTKETLISALVHEMLESMLSIAEHALAQPDGRGLEHFLEASSAYQAAHRGCLPRLWNIGAAHESVQRMRRMIATLLADAKRHGRAREELTNTDLTMVMWSIRGVIETTGGVAPQGWRRQLDIVLAGLRPADQPLRHGPLTRQQVDKVIAAT
jgi:AcrR family transcriptional regulator